VVCQVGAQAQNFPWPKLVLLAQWVFQTPTSCCGSLSQQLLFGGMRTSSCCDDAVCLRHSKCDVRAPVAQASARMCTNGTRGMVQMSCPRCVHHYRWLHADGSALVHASARKLACSGVSTANSAVFGLWVRGSSSLSAVHRNPHCLSPSLDHTWT
jgi:hypothetical protein